MPTDLVLLGEIAALVASVCFTFGPTLFTLAGRKVGGVIVNRVRLLLGSLYLLLFHGLYYGTPIPQMPLQPLLYFMASGLLGMALADTFMMQAFVCLGPRVTLLILNLSPALATVAAWILFDEHLAFTQLVAMAVVLGGVSWVLLERSEPDSEGLRKRRYGRRGIFYALTAASVGTVGTLLAKQGLRLGVSPVSGATVRIVGGMVGVWVWTFSRGDFMRTVRTYQGHPSALGYTALGVLVGPVIGMMLMLFSLKHVPVGIATTLTSLPPVLLLPVEHWVFGERITFRAVLGTIVATAGVVWLLLT